MNQNISTLARKTKTEILAEYERLVASIEMAKNQSHEAYTQTNVDTISGARSDFTVKGVEEGIIDLKATMSEKLADVSKKVAETLDTLMHQALKEVERFTGLTHAIDLAESRLKSQYNIEVVATTLETLVLEYADKKRQFELEHTARHAELTESITIQKRDWQREEEEHAYALKISRARELAQYEEKKKKEDAELQLREKAIRDASDELATLRARVESIPTENEKLLYGNEQEVTKRLAVEHTAHIERLERGWEAEKRILELKYSHLEIQQKKLETEVAYAKKEIESAQKKAQELAITVIEHGGNRSLMRNDTREVETVKS